MFDGSVLGVDPGMASAGLAVVRGSRDGAGVVWTENVRTPSGSDEAARLLTIYLAVRAAIADHRPDAVAVEKLMWGKNVGSAMSVSRATGVILLAAAEAGLSATEYAPLEVKMAVTGAGNAGKDQVRHALTKLHGLKGVPSQPDAADAVAVAFCHLQQAKLLRATGQKSVGQKAAAR